MYASLRAHLGPHLTRTCIVTSPGPTAGLAAAQWSAVWLRLRGVPDAPSGGAQRLWSGGAATAGGWGNVVMLYDGTGIKAGARGQHQHVLLISKDHAHGLMSCVALVIHPTDN